LYKTKTKGTDSYVELAFDQHAYTGDDLIDSQNAYQTFSKPFASVVPDYDQILLASYVFPFFFLDFSINKLICPIKKHSGDCQVWAIIDVSELDKLYNKNGYSAISLSSGQSSDCGVSNCISPDLNS